jgi:hypothetical protein
VRDCSRDATTSSSSASGTPPSARAPAPPSARPSALASSPVAAQSTRATRMAMSAAALGGLTAVAVVQCEWAELPCGAADGNPRARSGTTLQRASDSEAAAADAIPADIPHTLRTQQRLAHLSFPLSHFPSLVQPPTLHTDMTWGFSTSHFPTSPPYPPITQRQLAHLSFTPWCPCCIPRFRGWSRFPSFHGKCRPGVPSGAHTPLSFKNPAHGTSPLLTSFLFLRVRVATVAAGGTHRVRDNWLTHRVEPRVGAGPCAHGRIRGSESPHA